MRILVRALSVILLLSIVATSSAAGRSSSSIASSSSRTDGVVVHRLLQGSGSCTDETARIVADTQLNSTFTSIQQEVSDMNECEVSKNYAVCDVNYEDAKSYGQLQDACENGKVEKKLGR